MALYSIVVKTVDASSSDPATDKGMYKADDIIDVGPAGFDWGQTVADSLLMHSVDNVEMTTSETNLARMQASDIIDKTLLMNPQFRQLALSENKVKPVLRRKYKFNSTNSKVERKD